jgi:hypothetical protein
MKRAIQQTSSAAVLATGAELSRRGYDVTFTLGNTRKVDMLCAVPDGRTFKVQVKGLSNRNGFYIDKSFFDGATQDDLYLVVVYVPPLGTAGLWSFMCFLTRKRNANSRRCLHARRTAGRINTVLV